MKRALVTLASESRRAHVERQQRFAEIVDPRADRIIVWLDDTTPRPQLSSSAHLIHHAPGVDGLRLASARNAGADAARDRGAELLVFLDADCLPLPDLFTRYEQAAGEPATGLLCGPVSYLAEGTTPDTVAEMPALVAPHPARPDPRSGELSVATAREYDLFWSLSFALTVATWERIGGFDAAFEGYGGEDTDFAYRARAAGIPLHWVGGAHALHQYHATSSPPWQHLDDILRNGHLFAERWGVWPMSGWIDAFAAGGAIRWDGVRWVRTRAG
ncbi:glycosyltransferase family 2 protein [Marisediminicola sp. LYQ134]|uniref:glycosyltransferase family 2 protein n=1 Tax=Marisediminicola sp. LYQ134 TaxID=3391061 RepID=UPI0039832FCC